MAWLWPLIHPCRPYVVVGEPVVTQHGSLTLPKWVFYVHRAVNNLSSRTAIKAAN